MTSEDIKNAAKNLPNPKTLMQAVKLFSDPDIALKFMVALRWPGGVCCPRCGSVRIRFIATRRLWECRENHPSKRFSVKTGTVMEESPLPLDKWLTVIWLEVNAKNSISSYEVHRALGITQKSAWFMLHRVRLALQENSLVKLGGPGGGAVEVDETFIGGLARNMHADRRAKKITGGGPVDKQAVMGLLERHSEKKISQVRTRVIPNRSAETLQSVIHKNVEPGTKVFTDELHTYFGIWPTFLHQVVNHAERYVDGIVHTNTLENFWALFKRCIKGTHVSVEPFHLFRYLDAEAFRFNNRDGKDGDRFRLAVRSIPGKRLTYKGLIGQDGRVPLSPILESKNGSDEENGAMSN